MGIGYIFSQRFTGTNLCICGLIHSLQMLDKTNQSPCFSKPCFLMEKNA